MIDFFAIIVTSALASLQWITYVENRSANRFGFAVFLTLIAIAVMVH